LKDLTFLQTAVASGYLSGMTGDPGVNLINAPALLKEKGLKEVTLGGKGDIAGAAKSLRVTVKVSGTTFSLIGEWNFDC
jgi:hypothetical protein